MCDRERRNRRENKNTERRGREGVNRDSTSEFMRKYPNLCPSVLLLSLGLRVNVRQTTSVYTFACTCVQVCVTIFFSHLILSFREEITQNGVLKNPERNKRRRQQEAEEWLQSSGQQMGETGHGIAGCRVYSWVRHQCLN